MHLRWEILVHSMIIVKGMCLIICNREFPETDGKMNLS